MCVRTYVCTRVHAFIRRAHAPLCVACAGAHGIMFDIVNTHTRAVLVTGLQICAGDGTPHNYAVTLNPKP